MSPFGSKPNSRMRTPGRPSGVSSGDSSASMPASAPQPMTEVAKPVITVAAIIAHFGVSLVTMIAVPATSKASAKVSSTLMPLRVRSAMGSLPHARHATSSNVPVLSGNAASGTAKVSRPAPKRSCR